MSDYDAGSASARYKLDLTDFRKGAEEIRRTWQQLAQTGERAMRPPSVRGGASSGDTATRQQAQALRQAAQESDRALRAFQQIDRQTQRLADSEVRAARATGDYSRALTIIDEQLRRAGDGTARYNQLVAQRATVERQAAGETTKAASAFDTLAKGAALFGVSLGIQQLTQFAAQSYALSQQLAQQERSLSVLTRDQNLYNQAIGIAKQNQALFGGSLAENIDPLRTLTLNAQRYGIELKTLNDLAQRLVVLSPEQGAAGAGLALREALSGDIQSLVERFELPRTELAKIRDTSVSTADKLKILDGVLTSYGVTSQTVKDSITEAQQAQNRLNAEFEALQVAVAQGAAPAIEGITNKLADLFGLINRNPEAIAKLNAFLAGRAEPTSADLDAAKAKIAAEAQVDVRNRLTGATAGGTDYGTLARTTSAFTDERLDEVIANLTAAKLAGGELAVQEEQLTQKYISNTISAAELAIQSEILGAAVRQNTNTMSVQRPEIESLTDRTNKQTSALGDQISATQDATVKSDQLKDAQSTLAQLSQLVAAGLLSSADAAAFMKAQYGLAIPETEALIAAQNRLADARRNAANALNITSAQAKIEADRRAGRTGRGDSSDADEMATAAQARTDAVRAAQEAQIRATGTGVQQMALLRRELAQLTPGTAAYIEKQTELIQKQKQLDAERQRGATKSANAYKTEVNDAQRTADELVRIKRDQLQKLADAEQEYREKQQRASEDFAVRQGRDQEDYERKRRRLLAEGKRQEANELKEEFERSQRRDQEDFQRARRREAEDYVQTRERTLRDQGERTGDTQDKRDLRSTQRGYGGTSAASTTTPVGRPPSIASAAGVGDAALTAALAPRQLQIAFQANVLLDGQKVGELIGPAIVEQVDQELSVSLSVISTANSPGLQQPSVREVR